MHSGFNGRALLKQFGAKVDSCVKKRKWSEALHLLSSASIGRVDPDDRSKVSVLIACSRVSQWTVGIQLLSEVTDCAEIYTGGTAVIAAIAKSSLWVVALHIHESILQRLSSLTASPRFAANPHAAHILALTTSACSACERGAQWRLSLDLLGGLSGIDVQPDVVISSNVLSSCGKATAWTQGIALMNDMQTCRLAPNVISYSGVIGGCGRAGRWQSALDLFFQLQSQRLKPDAVCANAVVSACERGSKWQHALVLAREVVKSKVPLGLPGYCTTIAACEKGSLWKQAVSTFRWMRSMRLGTNVFALNSAISACELGAAWQWAVRLIDQVEKTSGSLEWDGGPCSQDAVSQVLLGRTFERAQQARSSCFVWATLGRSPRGLAVIHLSGNASSPRSAGRSWQRMIGEAVAEASSLAHHGILTSHGEVPIRRRVCHPVLTELLRGSDLLVEDISQTSDHDVLDFGWFAKQVSQEAGFDPRVCARILDVRRLARTMLVSFAKGRSTPLRPAASSLVVAVVCDMNVSSQQFGVELTVGADGG